MGKIIGLLFDEPEKPKGGKPPKPLKGGKEDIGNAGKAKAPPEPDGK